jgi:hypothetical protein
MLRMLAGSQCAIMASGTITAGGDIVMAESR